MVDLTPYMQDMLRSKQPDPTFVLNSIQIAMTREFGHMALFNDIRTTGIEFVVDDLHIRIGIKPEFLSSTLWDTPEDGVRHNGRWRLTLECPAVHPLMRRPYESSIEVTLKAFIKHIRIALERLHPKRPGLRLVVDNTKG